MVSSALFIIGIKWFTGGNAATCLQDADGAY